MNLKNVLNEILLELLREEELKCHKRARVKNLLDWHIKTKYFQLVANREHKTRIFRLDQEQDLIFTMTLNLKNISLLTIKQSE